MCPPHFPFQLSIFNKFISQIRQMKCLLHTKFHAPAPVRARLARARGRAFHPRKSTSRRMVQASHRFLLLTRSDSSRSGSACSLISRWGSAIARGARKPPPLNSKMQRCYYLFLELSMVAAFQIAILKFLS